MPLLSAGERIIELLQAGFSRATVAAILNVDPSEIRDAAISPASAVLPTPGGGGIAAAFTEPFDNLDAYTKAVDGNGLSASDGKLRWATPNAESIIVRNDFATPDCKQMLTQDVAATSYWTGLIFRYLDVNNFLMTAGYDTGTNTGLFLFKRDAGVFTTLASTSGGRLDGGTKMFLIAGAASNALTGALYVGHPSINRPLLSVSHVLTGGDATKFGAGVSGGVGIRTVDSGVGNTWDDHVCVIDEVALGF